MDLKKLRKELQLLHRFYLTHAMMNEDDDYVITMNRMFELIERLEKEWSS